jgi:hypothetical protein
MPRLASSILGGVIMKIHDTCPRMALTNAARDRAFSLLIKAPWL